MKTFRLSAQAARDVERIWEYISRDDVAAARRVRLEFHDAFEKLAEQSGIGHTRDDLTSRPVRFWPVRSYLVVYKPGSRPLEIVRVVHGARDLPRIL
jgi:plasmid stabilization system protein ParE